jgi:predicted O-linked N-acetylglucosamine transferase (SPINDLY family)
VTLRQTIEAGIDHHRAGRLGEAQRLYQSVLDADEHNFDALHLLGIAIHQSGDHQRALKLIERAIEINPSSSGAYNSRADVYRALGDLDEALLNNKRSIALNPGGADAYNGLAITLAMKGQFLKAIDGFKSAIERNPNYPEAYFNMGNMYQNVEQFDEAIKCYERAISIRPDFGTAHVMLGRAHERIGRYAEALAEYQEGLAIDPSVAEGQLRLGHLLQDQGLIDDALECFSAALKVRPDYVEARWAYAMSQLALVHEADTVESSRERFSQALVELDQWFAGARVKDGVDAVGTQQPFFLAYYENNNRELMSRYGDICSRLMRFWQERERVGLLPAHGETTVRVGIVSGQIRNHSVWNAIVKGWLQEVDRDRFSFHIFHTGSLHDTETTLARSCAAYYSQAPHSLREWVDEIINQRVDVLIYPEIGMDPIALKLASIRLAPVQAVAWGHPETSGLPTIDYYLSAEDFEPDGAQANYREKLVMLPRLGCYYQPLPTGDLELRLEEFGIDAESPILICAGAPFKYGPQYDWSLVEIAKRLKRCQLIFFHNQRENLSEKLERRLECAFEDAGSFFPANGLFLPWLNRDAFYSLLRRSTVYLDTIGFSGFNTAMQAIECGLPIVAKDGQFMRGRLASGILKRMGLTDLVARSDEEYIELAIRLASDQDYSGRIRRRIEANREVLFNDEVPVRALEDFLVRVSTDSR